MKRLTNDELMTEIKKFKRFQMESDKKYAILRELGKLENKKMRGALRFFKPLLSFTVLTALLVSGSFFALNKTIDAPAEYQTGIEQYKHGDESFRIQNETDFTIEENKDGTMLFMAEGKEVGGIQVLNEDEMAKSINMQNVFKKEELEGYQYPTTFTLDHQKTMDVVQILHYYFLSPDSKLRYHVYFNTPFFTEDRADEIASSFTIYKDGKEVKGKGEWTLSPEFETDTTKLLIGEKEKVGLTGPEFTSGKSDKYLWHFFGGHNEIEIVDNGDFKVIATNKETSSKEMVLVENAGTSSEKLVWKYDFPEQSPLTADADTGSFHSIPSDLTFSKPGIWKLDLYFGTTRYANLVVEVK